MFSEAFVHRPPCYFIGIGGVSMSALAMLLHMRGVPVRGSDAQEGEYTARLRAAGIPVHIGADEEISEDVVVFTGAIHEGHPQLAAAIQAGKRLVTRAELLGRLAEEYPHVLSVAGCHGKTTATCMLSHIYAESGKPFACHIGGDDLLLGNCVSRGGETFVTEACEFQRSFLTLRSEVAVVLNCDRDHTDCYRDEEELLAAYSAFAGNAKRVAVNADDARAVLLPHAVRFGLRSGEVRAVDVRSEGERYRFTVTENGKVTAGVRLNVVGRVHIYNALAAYTAARLAGLSPAEICRGLEAFCGVKRRFERVGTFHGVPVVCDYAHHPQEIAASFETAERLCRGTVRLVFQPHTYTRTRDLMKEFVAVLRRAENPVIYRTFAAREDFDFAGSAVALVSRVPEARYVQSPDQLRDRLLSDVREGDLILSLGAGDIYETMRSLLDRP